MITYNSSEKIELTRRKIIDTLNESDLSVDILYYILKAIFDEISTNYINYRQQVVQNITMKQQQQDLLTKQENPAVIYEDIALEED